MKVGLSEEPFQDREDVRNLAYYCATYSNLEMRHETVKLLKVVA